MGTAPSPRLPALPRGGSWVPLRREHHPLVRGRAVVLRSGLRLCARRCDRADPRRVPRTRPAGPGGVLTRSLGGRRAAGYGRRLAPMIPVSSGGKVSPDAAPSASFTTTSWMPSVGCRVPNARTANPSRTPSNPPNATGPVERIGDPTVPGGAEDDAGLDPIGERAVRVIHLDGGRTPRDRRIRAPADGPARRRVDPAEAIVRGQ